MNILISSPTIIVIDGNTHKNLLRQGEYNDGSQTWQLYLCSEDVTSQHTGSKLIGVWDRNGTVGVDGNGDPLPIDSDFLEYIQPIGNDAGAATDSLDLRSCWLGNEQRHVQASPVADTLPQYPADRQPYVVKVTRTVITDDAWSHIPHGFTFTLEFADPSRAPDARSFGVYSDEACTQYLWTPGAFQQVDVDGELVWQINCPIGQRTASVEPWNFAMLFGSAQEGRFTLAASQQTVTKNFFDADQGDTGGGVIEWAPGQSVVIGDLRTYSGSTYECRQSHTTLAGWEPPNVPALWLLV